MGNSFVQFVKGEDFWELIKRNGNAYVLLSVIAQRARRTNSKINNLEVGEAMIGDYETYGMTRQNYRTAIDILTGCNFITIKPTTKGTIAKIINTSIFEINIEYGNTLSNQQVTNDQPTGNQQVTTNNKDNKDNKGNKERNYSCESKIVLEKLNSILGKNYSDTTEILKRLKQGHAVEECLKIIDNKTNDPYFRENARLLNPVTLFRKSHFDVYLNDVPIKQTKETKDGIKPT